MDIPLDEVLFFDAVVSTPATGAAVDADSTPTFAVYEESTDTDIGVGGNMTKRTSLTGNYRGTFTASAANGFEVGKWYSVIGSAVVGGVTGKAVLKNFRVVLAEAVVGEPKVDVGALRGDAQSATDLKDFADDGYDPSTNKVQGLVLADAVTLVTTVTTLTNLPAITAGWLTATGIAADAITDAKIAVPAETAGRPTRVLAMLRRLWEGRHNKRVRTQSTGDLLIRDAADANTLETQNQSTTTGVDTQTKGV